MEISLRARAISASTITDSFTTWHRSWHLRGDLLVECTQTTLLESHELVCTCGFRCFNYRTVNLHPIPFGFQVKGHIVVSAFVLDNFALDV